MTVYYRLIPGSQSRHLEECRTASVLGLDFGIREDLGEILAKGEEEFRLSVRDKYLATHPEKTRPSGALAAGALWTLSNGMQVGDLILVSDGLGASGKGGYFLAEVTGPYQYDPHSSLPHQRPVRWLDKHISRDQMSEPLRNSLGSVLSLTTLAEQHALEMAALHSGVAQPIGRSDASDGTADELALFLFEKHLEDFLVLNWSQTALAREYEIVTDDEGNLIGQQYPTDTGPMDILAIARDGSGYLVVELKRDKASDAVVGQVQRYMGFVRSEIATPEQHVRGAIIAVDKDLRLERALTVAPDISFYSYEVRFSLRQG